MKNKLLKNKLLLLAVAVIVAVSAFCLSAGAQNAGANLAASKSAGTAVNADASIDPKVTVYSGQLLLDNQVYIKYGVKVENAGDIELSDVGMFVWKEAQTDRTEEAAYNIKATGTADINGTECYTMTFTRLVANEMNDIVTVRPYVTVNGKTYRGDDVDYSICMYAKRQLGLEEGVEGTNDPNLVALLRDMLRYGASAQRYTKYKLDNLADAMLDNRVNIDYHLLLEDDLVNNPNPNHFDLASGNVKLLAPSATGYTFKGWYTDENYETPVTEIDTSKPTTITLYAVWETNRYSITYKNTMGVLNRNEETYTVEDAVGFEPLSKYDYTFDGWTLDDENGISIDSIPAGTIGNLTLYANWTLKPEFEGFEYVIDENRMEENGKPFCLLTGVTDERNATSVTVSSVFNHIQPGAFKKCYCLEELTLPYLASDYTVSDNTNLGYLFGYGSNAEAKAAGAIPTNLRKLTVNSGVIGDYAFANLNTVKEIVLSSEVTEIGYQAFSNLESLEELTMPLLYVNRAKQEEKNRGNGLTNSQYYGLPGSRDIIDNNSAEYTGNQFKLHINGGGIYYGAEKDLPYEKKGCVIGNGFGNALFQNCWGISELTIDNITVVPQYAFGKCPNIKKITIGDTVEDIRAGAFFETGIEEIVIPDSVKEWGQSWLEDTGSKRIFAGVPDTSGSVFDYCKSLKKVTIGNGVVNIPAGMFRNCENLEEVIIGENVRFVDYGAFRNCNDTFEVINNSTQKEWVVSDPGSDRFMKQLMASENAPEKVYYGGQIFKDKQTVDGFTAEQIKDWNLVFYSPDNPYTNAASTDIEYWYHEDGANWFRNQYTVTPKMWAKPQS